MSEYSMGEKAPRPLVAPSEDVIVSNWKSDELVVSVICAAYQHESFIEDALNGFLAQKTDFRFEVIVRDDCSSDRTAEIIREYEKKYPRIVRGIYEPFNKWPVVKPGAVLRQAATGKFVAECEGDDYWIDELKLQKQVDYLESHKDSVLVRTLAVWTEADKVIKSAVEGGTRTQMYRNNLSIPLKYTRFIYFGDSYYQSILREHGDFATLNAVTAVWRKHSEGVFGRLLDSDERTLNLHRSQTQSWIAMQFYDEGKHTQANRHMAASVRWFLKTMSFRDIVSVTKNLIFSRFKRFASDIYRWLKPRH